MVTWLAGFALLLIAYQLGSIPTGYLVAKAVKGIDIREHGSGNTGATNVLRVVGKPAAIAVLTVDLAKGALAIILLTSLFPIVLPPAQGGLIPWGVAVGGLLTLLGHSKSIWLKWGGGKSAATGLGILLAMAWPVGLGVILVFALTLALSRIVSLGSLMSAVATVVLMLALQQPLPYSLLAIAGSTYVVIRHRSNIERLLAGTEPRLGSSSS